MDSWAWSVTGDATIPGGTTSQTVDVEAAGVCPGSYELQLDVVDGGVPSTCYYTVSVIDNEAPVITDCPGPVSVECYGEIPDPDIGAVLATDNCGDVIRTHLGDTSDGGSCPEIITRAYEAADLCGNADTCYQEITVHDTIAPEITFCPADDTVPCGDPINFGTPTANDNCDGAITPTIILDESVPGSTPGDVIHRRGWEMADACGNADTCYQEILEEACEYVPLTLSKDDDIADCVEREANITYTISYENTNTVEVTNVVLSDEMPSGVSYVSSNPAGTPSGSTVDWDLGTLAAGATGSVELVVQVDAGTTPGVTLTNQSMITSDETGSTTSNVGTEVCAAVYDPLLLTKVDDIADCVERGSNITYTITYTNPNEDGVTGVVLEDVIPPNTSFVSATGGGTEAAGIVTWDLGSLAGLGGSSVELVVEVDAGGPAGVTLTNNCEITSNETGATPATEFTDVCSAAFDPLSLLKTAGPFDCVSGGTNFTYTIEYGNGNADPVNDVVLTDNLPAGVSFVSATGGGTEAGGVVTWDLGTLAGSETGSVDLVVEVNSGITPGSTILNACAITSTETGQTTYDMTVDVCDCLIGGPAVVCPNSTTEYSTVGGADGYEWFITGAGVIDGDNTGQTVSVIAGPDCGEIFTLQVDRYQSFGVTTCYFAVNIADDEPPVLTCPDDFTIACGEPFEFGMPTATDNCVDPIIPVETSTTTTPGPGPGEFTHQRCWEAVDDCGNAATCCQTITEEACGALLISKSAEIMGGPVDCAEPGGEITYYILVENPFAVDAPNVVVIDDLPSGVDFVSANEGGSYDGGLHRVTWDLGTLLAGESRMLEALVQVGAGTPPGSNLLNNASIGSDNTVPATDALSIAVCGTGVMEINVDIKPTSCPNPFNTKAMGKIPVAILGTEYFDVYDVDPATVMLEGVPLVKYSYEDVATPVVDGEPCECNELEGDGYMDLVVHFNRPALAAAIGAVEDGDVLELMLTAAKYDGTALQGSDCVWILFKPNNGQSPPDIAVVPEPEETRILLSTQEAGEIKLVIYDVHGRAVARLLDEYKAAGSYDLVWDGKSHGVRVPAGVYFATASNSQGHTTKKFVVVR
jgi:uncharacterized repeat protein (TIGR01451 family)